MKNSKITWFLFAALIILSIFSLFVGVIDISMNEILGGNFEQLQILLISRLPRILAILCTGVGMSVAGLIMQQLCSNKFVSPSTGATISSAQLGIIAMDRDAAIGTEGAKLATEVLDNELVNMTAAAQNGNIIVLARSNVWYTAEGGITALDVMLSDLETALLD